MPIFKENKGIKGKFNSETLNKAVKEVLCHQASIREAAKNWNLNYVTLLCYVKQAKMQEENFNVTKLSMKTKQVCFKDCCYIEDCINIFLFL